MREVDEMSVQKSIVHRWIVVCSLCALGACGGPSPIAPTLGLVQVAGFWRSAARLTSFTGGECLASLLSVGNTNTTTMQISQSGSNLVATLTDTSTGAENRYAGSLQADTMNLTWQSCDRCVARIECSNGSVRDVQIKADTITARVSGSSASGTEVATYNLLAVPSGALWTF